jgi:preprotein translocase subunit SecA
MNSQREVIYTRRNRALQGDRLKGEIFDLLDEFVDDLVEKYFDDVNAEKLKEDVLHHFLVDLHIPAEQFESLGKDGIKNKIIDVTKEFYKKKEEMISSELMARLERYATLSVIDHKWKEHLREMDDLKEGIGLRAYGQKDPLVEYKGEAFKLFVTLLQEIRDEVVSFCFKFWPQAPDDIQNRRRREPTGRVFESKQSATNIGLTRSQAEGGNQQIGKLQPVHVEEKVGRNDPCPCGSGKKYKQCHGK